MVTEAQAADVEGRLQALDARGQAEFGSQRVEELVAIGQAPELPDEADDRRSLEEMIWWRDVLNVVAEAAPLVTEFFTRVNATLAANEVEKPEELAPEILVPLEAEAHLNLRIREAAAQFGFQLE
jgi:hypothetical protein